MMVVFLRFLPVSILYTLVSQSFHVVSAWMGSRLGVYEEYTKLGVVRAGAFGRGLQCMFVVGRDDIWSA
jgi:hypothetical protein